TPGDGGIATLDWQGNGVQAMNLGLTSATLFEINGFRFKDNGNSTTSYLVVSTGGGTFKRCKFQDAAATAVYAVYANFEECEAENWGRRTGWQYGFFPYYGSMRDCYAHDAAPGCSAPAYVGNRGLHLGCIAARAEYGFGGGQWGITYVNCDAYDCHHSGWFLDGGTTTKHLINCNAVNCGSFGFRVYNASAQARLHNCGSYGNGLGRITEAPCVEDINPIAYSRMPYRDPDNGDFTLVTPEAIGQGYQAFLDPSIVTGYPDVGAISPRRTYDLRSLRA
ncbi:MAG: right-handed parallel beta-helix repeat-containing protein, partial [Planctomycetota bacterium]